MALSYNDIQTKGWELVTGTGNDKASGAVRLMAIGFSGATYRVLMDPFNSLSSNFPSIIFTINLYYIKLKLYPLNVNGSETYIYNFGRDFRSI